MTQKKVLPILLILILSNPPMIAQDSLSHKKAYFSNPTASHYFLSPSAFNPPKKEAYYQNSIFLLNSVYYGVSDFFSVGAGIELSSSLKGKPLYYVMIKAGGSLNERMQLSGGVFYTSFVIDEKRLEAGFGFGILTVGNTKHNFSFGIGYGFIEGELAKRPALNLSGMTRIGRKISPRGELWLIPANGYQPFYTLGIQILGKRLSYDLGLTSWKGMLGDLPANTIPYIGIVWKLGKN